MLSSKKIKHLRFFIFLRSNNFFNFILRLLLTPLFLSFTLIQPLNFKKNLKVFIISFIINFIFDRYILEASIKKGEEIRNKNRIKRREANKN